MLSLRGRGGGYLVCIQRDGTGFVVLFRAEERFDGVCVLI